MQGYNFLEQAHLIRNAEAEIRNFLRLLLHYFRKTGPGPDGKGKRDQIARDRACNMGKLHPVPGIAEVLDTLSKTHKLGIIPET